MSMQLTAAAALGPTRQLLQMFLRCLSTQAWGKSKPQDPLKTNKDMAVRLGGRLGCSLNEDTNDFLLTINDDMKIESLELLSQITSIFFFKEYVW
jgi:hypothetical protein